MSFAQSPTQVSTFDAERLSLDPAASGSLVVGTGRLLKGGDLRVGTAFHYEKDPLGVYQSGQRLGGIVNHRFNVNIAAAFGLHDRVELGLSLPALIAQTGDDMSAYGIRSPSTLGLGTPWLQARFGILGTAWRAPLDLSIALALGLPVGSVGGLSREDGLLFAPRLELGRALGPILVGADVGVLVRPSTALVGSNVGNQFGAGFTVATHGRSVRGEFSWRGQFEFSGTPSIDILAGIRIALSKTVGLFSLVGQGFGGAPGTPSFRAILGVELKRNARAPARPARPAHIKGVAHIVADCPDRDLDGILDADDACPDTYGAPETHGCPLVDTDGDGLFDHEDGCPANAGPAWNRGCPVKEPEPPKTATIVVRAGKIELREKVFFAYNRAKILPKSFALLNGVAAVLKKHPEITTLLVEGHTDSAGARKYNLRLSAARAKAVRAFLVKAGVAATRLEAQGFGPDQPIDSNKTAAGRENNRRVELTIKSRGAEKEKGGK